MPNSWTCPFCNQIATITANNISYDKHEFDERNKEGCPLWLDTFVTVCPNSDCREYTVEATLYRTKKEASLYAGHNPPREAVEPPLAKWTLRPRSNAKPFPSYIPAPILSDYQEACLIVNDSGKASATLSRRCLQGIIRDFWGISKNRLVDEVNELKSRVDPGTWGAIDAVRSIGNIGAHMEKDINLIVDVEPGEAEVLIKLLETLFKEWYVARHERERQMNEIVAIAKAKAEDKKATL